MTTAKPSILIVDNDEDWLSLLERILISENYSVISSRTCDEALELAERCLPNCIITDLGTGEAGGLDLCGRLKEHPELKRIPVIILSGLDETEISRPDGCAAFVCKGNGTKRLIATLDRVLDNKPSGCF